MSDLIQHSISVFLSFFAIMNPIANTPVFIGLTSGADASTRKTIAIKALTTSFFIVLLFAILGKGIFVLFGITLPAMRIAGGILIFLIGYQMLHGESSTMHKSSEASGMDIAISPLAVPILAGPGTISTAMNYSAAGGWLNIVITIASFAFLSLVTFVFFQSGERIIKMIGTQGINIVTRIMGLILAVIGAQLVIEGVYDAINAFEPSQS